MKEFTRSGFETVLGQMNGALDITVLMTTFNNASELGMTLEGFCNTDRQGLTVEFVIVDNHSTDATKSVIESFAVRLPIRYLHEPRKGKCAALNRALDTMKPGRLVFFTDDDVNAPKSLFQEVVACASRHPASGAFGGKVHLDWPPGPVPAWATTLADNFRGYSHLNLGPEERLFPTGETPVGTNWWVRREVLERGYRFDERIGPGMKRCTMGDETAFLLQLERDGCAITYTPNVRIGHRVPQRLLDKRQMLRRGLAAGTAGAVLAYEYGFGPKRLIHSILGWRVLRSACLVRWVVQYAAAFLNLKESRRMLARWDAIQGIGWNLEALRLTAGGEIRCGLPPLMRDAKSTKLGEKVIDVRRERAQP